MMKPRRLRPEEIVRRGDLVDDGQGGFRPYTGVLHAEAGEFSYPLYRRWAIVVIGHGGHGKGEVCRIMSEDFGAECLSSSAAALPHILPALNAAVAEAGHAHYLDAEHAYGDRRNHRVLWRELIALFNAADRTTLSRTVLDRAEVYDGMRSHDELIASRHLFDLVVYVDASKRVGTVDTSLDIPSGVADVVVDNNGSIEELRESVRALYHCLIEPGTR